MSLTPVYIVPGTLSIGGVDGDGPLALRDAARALSYLADAGHQLVLIESENDPPLPPPLRTHFVQTVAAMPDAGPGWLLTSDVAHCERRSSRVRTILVGPPTRRNGSAVVRCDLEARDIRAAVLEILTNEAMPTRR